MFKWPAHLKIHCVSLLQSIIIIDPQAETEDEDDKTAAVIHQDGQSANYLLILDCSLIIG